MCIMGVGASLLGKACTFGYFWLEREWGYFLETRELEEGISRARELRLEYRQDL